MQTKGTIRLVMAAAMLMAAALSGLAQVAPYGEKSMGEPAQDHLPDILNTVKIAQRLGHQLPLDAPFRDETGKAVKLGDYFFKSPSSFRWSITGARFSARKISMAWLVRWRWST